MKKVLILLIAAFIGAFSSWAYMPMVREGVKWVYNDEYSSYNEPDIGPKVMRIYTLEIKGDTIIEGTAYKKCYRHSDINLNGKKGALFCSDAAPTVCLREDKGVIYAIYVNVAEIMFDLDFELDDGYFGLIGKSKPVTNDQEHVLYDFNDPQMELVSQVNIGGKTCGVYKSHNLRIVESVGMDCYDSDILVGFAACNLSLWYSEPMLHHMEDADGNIIYKGIGFHSDGSLPGDKVEDGKIDVSDVNGVIDVVLQGQGYDPVADMNSDGIVDIADVNTLIDYILGK